MEHDSDPRRAYGGGAADEMNREDAGFWQNVDDGIDIGGRSTSTPAVGTSSESGAPTDND